MPREVLVGEGAEGQLFAVTWNGRKAVRKIRIRKTYRHPQLDSKLRSQRTRREAKALRTAFEAKVPCPELFEENQSACELLIERIEGELLARKLGKATKGVASQWLSQAGSALAKLHARGLVHGDFTTSNVMVDSSGTVQVIDFGLSSFSPSVEEQATDVLLFEKSLEDAQARIGAGEFFRAYAGENKNAPAVQARVELIRSRGRYQQRK